MLVLISWASDSFSRTGQQGFNVQGFNVQGFNVQGFNVQGFNVQGFNVQGTSPQGFNVQGTSPQGFNVQGFNVQGFNVQGFNVQGFNVQGFNVQGFNVQGPQLRGIDRGRGMLDSVDYQGLVLADVQAPAAKLQGLQPPDLVPWTSPYTYGSQGINYVQATPPAGITLQADPTHATPGSYIYVPGLSGTANDIKGTFWNMVFADSTGPGAIGVYVSDVSKDAMQNLSQDPSNSDVYLYTVYYRHPVTEQWLSLCPVDPLTGTASAMAIPLDIGDWSSAASRQKFTFACTATGVGSKCARNWGYKPWKSSTPGTGSVPLKPFYDSCVIAARADYCQDGQSYTKNGTMVDLFDSLAFNPTSGLPYLPNSASWMMHEEYQISALDPSTSATTQTPFYALGASDLAKYSAADQAVLSKLRTSGMESSRYGDLDPGRSCLAAPWIDRCDPHEPYTCYRDADMGTKAYGAFVSVNSPRHCSHDELHDGEPLDPLCNACVSRVCSVDPTCCGDTGGNLNPVSLVWDSRCAAISKQVCRSSTSPADAWAPGNAAPVAGSTPLASLQGALGSFEGIVMPDGTTPPVLEGWACDPDFAGASAPVQVSVGGPLGTAGTTLITGTADAVLKPEWKAIVADACGGAGRHGFRIQVPNTVGGKAVRGQDVYVYAVDLNVPGAPFTLLRGGKKTIPGAAPQGPVAAIWSGWLEAPKTDHYTFSVAAGAGDSYRVWVNGAYVQGRWPTPDPTSPPGGYTPPAAPASVSLLQGVRYPVRIEYQRPSATSTSSFTLSWSAPVAGLSGAVPASVLYPAAPRAGSGLVGTYYPGSFSSTTSTKLPASAVDFVWTKSCVTPPAGDPVTCNVLPAGLSVDSPFAVRFEGQVVPPVSGDYTFTADTEGTTSIWIDGQLVTDASRKPPSKGTTCSHDICRTGAAESSTCDQGYYCAAEVCRFDPACCSITWDAACLQEVGTICHLECRQTAPIPITLRAGVKYDIKIEFQHPGVGTPKLKLFWALGGGARADVPASQLYGEGTPAKGVGLNAAYFSDAFITEILDHVDGASFTGSSPSVLLASTLGDTVTDAIGAPSLTLAPSATLVTGSPVNVIVGGLAHGSSVSILDGTTVIYNFPSTAGDGGELATGLTLAAGSHTLTARATAGSSATSPPLTVSVVDVAALTPVVVTPPSDGKGFVASSGRLVLGGTAAPNASVTVSGAGTTSAAIKANATTGAWSNSTNPYVLPGPGLYTLTITETLTDATGTHTSQTTINARVPLPPLSLKAPYNSPDTVVTGAFSLGATSSLTSGEVWVADGDGQYFVERAHGGYDSANQQFTVTVPALDPGRHVLKVFQRVTTTVGGNTNTLDGDPQLTSVVVTPSTAAPALTCSTTPSNTADVNVTVSTANLPTRTGLRYGVAIYQGPAPGTKIGQATVVDAASFQVPVRVTGVGSLPVFARLVVSSLSGGGAVESSVSSASCNVLVKPQPPVVKTPATNPYNTTSTTVSVTGTTAATTASVTITVDGVDNVVSTTTGSFSKGLTVAKGAHVMYVKQTIGGVTGLSTAPMILYIGDVNPPVITVDPAYASAQPPATGDDAGEAVDVVALRHITAVDGTTSVAITCSPPAGTKLPLGTTNILCTAKDAAGNASTTMQTVVVKSSVGPALTGNNVVAEATGPGGAAVKYKVAATGFVADCAPPGSTDIVACTSWNPVTTGLGFQVNSAVLDPRDGSLYASAFVAAGASRAALFRLDPTGTWTQLDIPGPRAIDAGNWSTGDSQLAIAPNATAGAASTLFVPTDAGLLAVTLNLDKTFTTTNVLTGLVIRGVAVDPNDPRHLFAWNSVPLGGGPVALFESIDAGVTWGQAGDGLALSDSADMAYPHISGVAFDRVNAGRVYVQIAPYSRTWSDPPERVYRRVGHGAWERRGVPPTSTSSRWAEAAIAVAPTCSGPSCFPAVYAAGAMSLDGGESWVAVPGIQYGITAIAFDSPVAGSIVALDDATVVSQSDSTQPFKSASATPFAPWSLLRDPAQPKVLYGALRNGGLYKSADAGVTWAAINPPTSPGVPATILDMAFDPSNAGTAYLLSESGFFKSTNGGDSWALYTPGIAPGASAVVPGAAHITLDPFGSQKIALSGKAFEMQQALLSTDGAGTQQLPWTAMAQQGQVVLDPAITGDLFNVRRFSSDGFIFESKAGNSYTYILNGLPSSLTPLSAQVLPDPARTMMLTFLGAQATTIGFSIRDANVVGRTVYPTIAWSLAGSNASPVFDGRGSVFVNGAAAGDGPDVLYKADVSTFAWTAFVDGPTGIDFRRLAIDQGSEGQVMYTVGADNGLWVSRDGGLTWAADARSPSYIRRIWTSPLDGAVYAAVVGAPMGTTDVDAMYDDPDPQPKEYDTLWRLSPKGALPADATIVKGPLRFTCAVAGGRTYAPGGVFPIGTTSLTCTATDVFGNPAAQALPLTVQVVDTTGPVITVAPFTVPPTSGTSATATFTVTAKDAVDGAVTPTCTPASGSSFNVGVTTVKCTATDSRGNGSSLSFPVTVTKSGTTPAIPTLSVPPDMTVEATSASGAVANPIVTAKTSTGAPLGVSCTPTFTSATVFKLGTTAELCSATASGFTVTRSFNVTVVDTTPPKITLPVLPSPIASDSPTGAHVSFTIAATDTVDGCIAPTTSALASGVTPPCTPSANAGVITCTPASGSLFGHGTTAVTCRANDKAGNIAVATLDVVVQDATPPVITVPKVQVVEQQDRLGARATYAVSANDVQDGPVTPDCAPASGSWFPPGDSSVYCSATDLKGNTSHATFTVRVVDTTPPTVTVPVNLQVEATQQGGATKTFVATAFDVVSQAVTPACSSANGVSAPVAVSATTVYPIGKNVVTCKATDGAGNTGAASFVLTVVDTKGPTLPPLSTRFFEAGADGTAIGTFTLNATDWGTPVPYTCTPASGSRFLMGTTTVTCVARDGVGNETRTSFSVVVRDTKPPVMAGVPATTIAYAPVTTGAAVTYKAPTANDVVDGARPVTCTPASGTTFAPGKTAVTCTAKDLTGNTGTATFTVWVQFDTREVDGTTYVTGLANDGSSLYGKGSVIPVAFALTGASAPITNLAARASVAPVAADGTVGTFVDATPGSGTGNLFTYDAVAKRYGFPLATSALTPGTYRFRADLGDGNPHDVGFTLSGTSFTLAPSSFNYGPVVIGRQGLVGNFAVKNITTSSLTMTSALAVINGSAPEFTVTANTCTTPLAAGAVCTVAVVMSPQTPGPKNATLTVTSSAGDSLVAQLAGQGWRPAQLGLTTATSINFGNVPLLTQVAGPGQVTIKNLGDEPLGPITLGLAGADFFIANNGCGTGLPGGQTCNLNVGFVPTVLGARSATLTINASPGGTATVSFTGVGINPLAISPTSFTFGSTLAGAPGPTQVFTVSSSSAGQSAPLTTALTSTTAFRTVSDGCAGHSIVAGTTCAVTVQFMPPTTSSGVAYGANLNVNGAAGWTTTASLGGTSVVVK